MDPARAGAVVRLGTQYELKEKTWPQLTPPKPWLRKVQVRAFILGRRRRLMPQVLVQAVISPFRVVEGAEDNTVFSKRQLRAISKLAGPSRCLLST